MLPQFFMKLKKNSPTLSIPFITAGMLFILMISPKMGNIVSHEDFISGWLKKNGSPSGRPVDIEYSPEGELYLSDDLLGVVYKISGN